MTTGEPIPELGTASAYLGAFPIARALAEGADIVVTGRCVDSALALGPLIHAFGWTPDDLDALAGGSLAGHVIECGPQSTGGFFTDWNEVSAGWADIGFPIAEVRSDGSFVLTKPPGTGGLVSFATVAEQITYEIGDPRSYVLPDVVCDLADIRVRQIGPDAVEVAGARGRTPPPTFKVSGTCQDGFRCVATLLVKGQQAVAKARAVAHAILQRTTAIFERERFGGYSETSIEVLGAEESYIDAPSVEGRREVVLKIAVRHREARALEVFSREVFPTSTSTVQGLAGIFGGRPKVQPMLRLFSFLAPKEMHRCTVRVGGASLDFPAAPAVSACSPLRPPDAGAPAGPAESGPEVDVPLSALAWSRSGDKGDLFNVGAIARRPEYYPYIAAALTVDAVTDWFVHMVDPTMPTKALDNLLALKFVLNAALSGGAARSLRSDNLGKTIGGALLRMEIDIDDAVAATLPRLARDAGGADDDPDVS